MIRIAAALVAGLFPASAQASDESPCRAHENGKLMDFWLGDWRVMSMDGKTVYGENNIMLTLDGCAIHENWRSAEGGQGQSLFYFDARKDEWRQIWVTDDTSKPGSIKRKGLTQVTLDGGLRFRGRVNDPDGSYEDRTTLTPLPNGDVRQHIEVSTDNGATWRTVFDARYKRFSPANE